MHVQLKFDDVEQKLTDHVRKTIEAQVGKAVESFEGDAEARNRLASVENQLLSIAKNQTSLDHEHQRLTHAMQACNAQVQAQGQTLTQVAQEVGQRNTALSMQGTAISQVVNEVGDLKNTLHSSLQEYFHKQTVKIEAMLAKKQCTERLSREEPSLARKVSRSCPCANRWFASVFLRAWIFFSCFVRIGEAAVPGPVAPDTYLDSPRWSLPVPVDFCLGVGNPSGISNKLHTLEHFPYGWWHLVGTQASKYQQRSFQTHVRSMSYRTGRCIRSSVGAPANLRAGSLTWKLDWGVKLR